MRILCAISGIEFQCEHFPLTLHARESYHPVFNVPQRKLFTLLPKWSGNELTQTDSYLLFLSLLKSSDLVEFRTSARRTNLTDSIVAQNMEHLVKTLSRLNTVMNPHVIWPHYVIGHETCDLATVSYWIENWNDSYQDYLSGASKTSAHDLSKINRREAALERLIKNPHKKVSEFAGMLADWASAAGSFPTSLTLNPFSKLQVPLSDYWKLIITKCANEESIFSIPQKDIQELLTHCEDEIPHGTIHSHHVFKILRHALERQRNFLSLGDTDLRGLPKYGILGETSSTEEANMTSLIANAPESEPRRDQYPNLMGYMKAKMRWTMAQKMKRRDSQGDIE